MADEPEPLTVEQCELRARQFRESARLEPNPVTRAQIEEKALVWEQLAENLKLYSQA